MSFTEDFLKSLNGNKANNADGTTPSAKQADSGRAKTDSFTQEFMNALNSGSSRNFGNSGKKQPLYSPESLNQKKKVEETNRKYVRAKAIKTAVEKAEAAEKEYDDYIHSTEAASIISGKQVQELYNQYGIPFDSGYSSKKEEEWNAKGKALKKKAEQLRAIANQYQMEDLMDGIDSKAEQAEQEYQDYIHSEEYAAWQLGRQQAQENLNRFVSESGIPIGLPASYEKNEKEDELKRKASYYRNLANRKKDEELIQADMKELESWPEEDQQALKRYMTGRTVDFYDTMNVNQNGIRLGNAEREAAGLFQKYGKQRVDEIAESYSRLLSSQNAVDTTQQAQNNAGKGFWSDVGQSIGSVGLNLIGSVNGVAGYANELAQSTGRFSTLDPYNMGNIASTYAGAVRGKIAENLEEKYGAVGSTLYQAGMSALDNLARIATVGDVGSLALAATGSFSQAVSEYSKQGATPFEALTMGVISGGLEVLTEKVSLDRLLKDFGSGKKSVTRILKDMLIQGGIEVSEEEASLLGTILAEAVILQERSSFNQEIEELQVYGMTKEEAREKACWDVVEEAAQTAIQSFLSGGMMSGATSVYSNTLVRMQERAEQKQLKKTVQQAAQEIQNGQKSGSASVTVPEGVTVAAEKVQQAERISRATGRQIEFYSKDGTAAVDKTGEKDVPVDKEALAPERRNTILPTVEESPAVENNATTEPVTLESLSQKYGDQAKAMQAVTEDKPFELSDETGKTLLNMADGSTVETEITGIASNEKGKLMLNVSGQSEPVRASSISYASAADAFLYNAINSMDITPAAANKFVELAQSYGDTTGEFAVGIQQMYTLGESGVPLSKAVNSGYAAKLSDTMKKFGYYLGRRVYDAQVQKAEAEKKNVAASQRASASAGGTKVNGVQYDGLTVSKGKDGSVVIDGVKINEQQKAGIQAAEMLAKMGVNVHVFQIQTGADGKPIGENGSYSMRDGSLHIDLNAGNLGQGVMAYTISHEFTHFMEQQSPAKFQAFTDALFAELDVDVEAEITNKAKELKQQHPEQYKNVSRETLLSDARSEVVAEACETMLTDTDAAQRIGQSLKAKDTSLFEKVKQWFRDLAQKLRDAYKDLHPDSEIAQYAKKAIQQVDGLVQMWADMAVDAADNYRGAVAEDAGKISDDAMYSIRRTSNMSWGQQIRSALKHNGKIQHMDTLVVMNNTPAYLLTGDTVNLPMAIPLSVITKAQKGKNADHAISDKNLIALQYGMENAIAVIDNPGRNSLAFITSLEEDGGKVAVFFDKNVQFDGDQVNKATSIHRRTNIVGLMNNLSDDATIYVKNKNEFDALVGMADSIPAAYKGKIKFVDDRISQEDNSVKLFSDRNDVESDFYNAGVKYSSRVTDKDTLSFLDSQETITTYKTMQIVDGKLYPPMAARIDGKHEDYSVLGAWEQATEHPELIKGNGKFKLDKGKGRGSIEAAYNPYMHSSNLVINDQFTGAYMRDNLVTVECEVPSSELTSGYHAPYAKDSVGWHAWHTGTVAGAIRKAKGIERQVFLSRWIKPVRIVTDAEVASMYRELLDGTDIAVPDNVVTPSLLSELKKAGVTIGESGRVKYSDRYSQRQQDQQAVLEKQNGKLREDVERLRELLKLQGKTTGGKLFKPESIKTAANFIMRETGRNLDADGKAEFAGLLTKAYTALSDENVTYDDIIRECTNVAQWLDENGETQEALDEYAGGILSQMKGIPISLNETQKAEARHLFGSLREFRSRIAGTYKLSPDGVPLDDVWNGLSIDHPMFFDGYASSDGLPGILVEVIDRLRGCVNTDPYQHMPVDMMMRKVYDGFWKAKKLTTVADRYQSKIDAINAKHDAAMREMQEAHKAEVSDLKRKWDEEAAAMEKSHKYDLEEQERLHKEHLAKVREKMNHDAKAELEKVIGQYTDRRKASVENRHRTQYREQIYKMADKFHKMATAPAKSNTAHAPIQLVNAVSKFCEIFADSEVRALEYAANRLDSRETELQLMNDLRGETKTRLKEADAINRQRERLFKKHQAVSAMKEQYSKIHNDPVFGMFYDEHVNGLLESLSKQLDGTDIYDMETEQLKQVYSTMQAMMYTITNANRVFSMGKDKTLIGVTQKLAGEIDANKISHGAFASGLRDYGMWQMSPDTFFNFLCGFKKENEGKAIQKMFVDGTDRMLEVQRDFYQMFRHLTEAEDKNVRKHITQMMKNPMKEMIDWGLKDAAGNPVKTTRDMMIQAYMLLNQKDSFDSLIYGGFKIPNAKDYYNGKIDRAYGNAEESALLSASIESEYGEFVRQIKQRQDAIDSGGFDVKTVNQLQDEINSLREQAIELVKGSEARLIELRNAIEDKLTDADLDAIETAKRWYKYTGQLMTDVYLQMYGYRPNLVDGYVPIHRDLSTVKTDIREGEENKAFNLENSGFTKDRVKSRAPILLTGFFQELQNQQVKISRYYGFANVQKDFNRIWNMRVPGYGMTINGKVAAKFGTGKRWLGVSGEQYVLNYIQSVAGVRGNEDILSSFYGNAASATLCANPRVAVSQLASIPTASAVVGWKSMAKGFAKGVRTSISTEKKNLLANDSVWFFQRYRGAGGITEISDLKTKGGFWGKIANSPVGKGLFNWCQSMDVFATASMWAMAEDYVQQGGMKTTDDGYKLAVEQCYADIIRKSQPNYTVTERSDLLRDKRGGMKLLTMYKTQSNQNLNILINSIGEYRAAATAKRSSKNETTISDFKAAKKNLVNGITSVTIGGTLAFVLLRTLVNFIMAKVDPYRDDETDELTVKSAMGAVTKEALSSISGMFALGGQLYDIVNSVVYGDNYYGISDSAISNLTAVPESMVALAQRWKDQDKDVEWKHVEKVLSSTLALCGIPYKNLKSFYDAAGQWYRDLKGGTFGQYVTDATDKQYRARILKAWQSGDMEKINDTLAILAAKSEEDTDEEILKDVTHGFANNYLKDKVKSCDVLPEDAMDILEYIGHDDPEGVVQKWVFQMTYPDIDSNKISDKLVSSYNQRGDINEKVFLDAYWFASSAQVDKDEDGKPINGSKKAKIVKYIQSIPGLSFEQQKRLFILLDVGSSKDTPWE